MAGRSGAGVGRPPLTERRRAETRMEIADEAVRLFVERGVAGTTAEDIAAAPDSPPAPCGATSARRRSARGPCSRWASRC